MDYKNILLGPRIWHFASSCCRDWVEFGVLAGCRDPSQQIVTEIHKMALAMVRRNVITHYSKFASSWSVLSRHSSIHNPSSASVSPFHSQSVGGGGGGGGGLPSYMRGAVYWETNKPLSIEEFHMPRPKAGEVLIKTKGKGTLQFLCMHNVNGNEACGVCHSDLHVIKGEIPFSSPCVLGHEITGEVVEHGPHSDSKTIERLPVGSRVVGSFIMPCGNCSYCSKGHDDLCEAFFAYNRAKGTLYDAIISSLAMEIDNFPPAVRPATAVVIMILFKSLAI
ncbi:hypothetical protein V8G54_002517 [Vigna mungo]|uniref:Alcohol dehydrogenase-like N-terminal domain-containing protein n=1 Tax=Vigna mungo TaxID=3915 RepID=A0AAQ3SBY4_VIGMU